MFPTDTRILLTDDSQTTRSLLRTFLKNAGYGWHLHEAEHGVRALEILREQEEKNKPIQLILSDWEMPLLSGLDFLKKVREEARWKTIPFIMITSVNRPEQVVEAVKAGVTGYIVKPLQAETLLERMKTAYIKSKGLTQQATPQSKV
jgi:two-component system chemotaxis response regulator CheY